MRVTLTLALSHDGEGFSPYTALITGTGLPVVLRRDDPYII